MADIQSITFIDNPAAGSGQSTYISVIVDTALVLESWRSSLFSFEWLTPEGAIKTLENLPAHEQPKRRNVEEKISTQEPIEKPVLGIGIMDNIEIGAGRAEFLTLITHGATKIPVHIPKSCESDFKPFIVAVSS
jgi:hypothetical protein